MIKIIRRALTLFTFLLMYVTLEFTLFKELGWQGGLVASLFFSIFGIGSLAGLLYRPPFVDLDEGANKEANCRP